MAALNWDGGALHLAQLNRLADPKDVVRWVKAEAGEDSGIGIDAPLVIPNKTGMRTADRLTQSMYGRYDAGAYPASRARSFWKRTTGLAISLGKLGFRHGDELAPRSRGRFQIEVYPHAASVQLFALDRIVKYKKGPLAGRAAELARLRGLMLEHLPLLVPSLALAGLPEIPGTGRELKAIEDQLDALLAAYVAAHWWYWGRERNDVLGDSKQGYMVVPHRQTPQRKPADLGVKHTDALSESDLDANPISQFQEWFGEALSARIDQANAMTLATTGADGLPSARMVLLKEVSEEGFVFYTSYRSQKGRELARNPHAALVFYWRELERQVRVTGQVVKTSRAEADAYFHTRPCGAQLAAWASRQSSVIPDRQVLEARVRRLEQKYAGRSVPLPPSWGGFRLRPDAIEFWQGRPDRLHDRLRYSRQPDRRWRIERLAP